MPAFQDLTGKRFGRWTVVERAPNFGNDVAWYCKCDCGTESVIRAGTLRNGKSTSCGCRRNEVATDRAIKHGLYYTRLYSVWANMKNRCLNPNHPNYHNYGGRGIGICIEWANNFTSFYDWAMMSGYDPEALRSRCTIDRIDVNGNYEPSNCRWVSNKVQSNNRRTNRIYTYGGQTHTLAEWAEMENVTYSRMKNMLARGKPFDEVMKIILQEQDRITEVE